MTDILLPVDLARYQWEWNNGSRKRAVELAKEHIAANPELIDRLSKYTRDQLVSLVDEYTKAGQLDDVITIDMWLQAGYDGKLIVEGRAIEPIEPLTTAISDDIEQLHDIMAVWRNGFREAAVDRAKFFVNAHRDKLTHLLSPYSREDLVALCDRYNVEGRKVERDLVEVWLLSEYEPQKISGSFNGNARAFIDRIAD